VQGSNILNNGQYAFKTSACHDAETTIDATNNWWGVADSAAIEELIDHQHDNANYPTVTFIPFATSAFDLEEPD
jgi:hypothetical protein